MRAKSWLMGAAAVAAVAGMASPAAAQYYPYPQNGGVVGAILNGVLGGGYSGGYGNYGYGNNGYGNERIAVDQCARATEARLSGAGYGQYPGGYGAPAPYGYPGGAYGTPYGNGARLVQVTGVERKSYGFHVRGVASSGSYGGAYGGYGAYGSAAGGADLKVNCKVEANGRVRDVQVRWIANNRPYYGANYRGY